MKETILMIDGENFKNKIEDVFKENTKEAPVWHEYDFAGLLNGVLKDIKIDKRFFYFARIKEHEDTVKKSKELIEIQRRLKSHLENQGFKVIIAGRVRGQYERDKKGEKVLVFKEKGVDVRIGVDMVTWACDKVLGTVIVGSSDSDLQPAIYESKRRQVECIYLGFETNPNKGLSYTTKRTILIRNSEVLKAEKLTLF